MAHVRNHELWLEIQDRFPIFSEEDHPSHKYAWDFLTTLMEGRLNSRDIICLGGLLDIVADYRDDWWENPAISGHDPDIGGHGEQTATSNKSMT